MKFFHIAGKICVLILLIEGVKQSSATSVAFAAETRLRKVESVLDRLERYLLDNQSDVLTFDETKKEGRPPGKVTPYSFSEDKIEARVPKGRELEQLAQLVAGLESEVDTLESEAQRTRQGFLEKAAIHNYVQIEVEVVGHDAATLRSFAIKLDGYEVWRAGESGGIWVPDPRFPIYRGPMQPGEHMVDAEVRVAMNLKEGIPVQDSSYKLLKKSFPLEIPAQDARTNFVMRLKPPTDQNSEGGIELTSESG